MTLNLMFPGVVAFVLVLIGLALTVIEFKRMEREDKLEEERKAGASPKQ